ncbi:MAG TPA: MFS transporter [Candidatus Saccharimonadales bacterium]|nr:MFS transporter [Candidatus Saccharimonadales bacterium]
MHKQRNAILLLLATTMFLVVLDSAIVNVALPAIKSALHFDSSALQWVLTAYILTFGGFLMLGGRIADLYGRRKVLIWGIGGFTLFSLLLGLAASAEMMVVLRAFQGLAAAFMAPTALSILLTTFEEGPARNRALSIWSMVASGGAAAGVFLGGLLTQYLGWRWCFFVNVPIGIIAILGILKYVPAHIQEARDKHLDMPGAVLVTGGLMALVYALTQASESGWGSLITLISLCVSALLLVAFLWNETKAKHPLVPLSIFRIRNVSGGNLMMLPVSAGALGMFFFLSVYVQNILKFPPLLSGLAFLPLPLIIGVISLKAPKLLGKFGFKPLIVVGLSLIAIGTFALSFLGTDSSYWFHILPAFVLLAVGFGLSFLSVTIASTAGVPGNEAGLASGLVNTSQQIGGALGLAILAVVATSTTAQDLNQGHALAASTVHGYQLAFLTASVLMVIALLIAIFIIRTPKQPQAAAEPAATHV